MADESRDAQRPVAYSDYAERSRLTQQHILDTAIDVLIELGYSGASTLKIQQRAGLSRGRLLHQYPQRDELLVAAVQRIAAVRVVEAGSFEDWPDDLGERVDAVIDAMWQMYQQGYFWAATELWLAARHNAQLAAALKPREQALGASIRAAHDEMFGPVLSAHPNYPTVREVLNTSMRGVALAYSFDPRDPIGDGHVAMWKALAHREFGLSRV